LLHPHLDMACGRAYQQIIALRLEQADAFFAAQIYRLTVFLAFFLFIILVFGMRATLGYLHLFHGAFLNDSLIAI